MGRIGKTSALLLTLIIAISCLSLLTVKPANAQDQGITINSDGSITPSTAPVQKIGNNYILTSDIQNARTAITIQRSNTVFDGNGHKIVGINGTTGVLLDSVQNVVVKNLVISGCPQSIELDNTSNVTVTNNTISNQVTILTFESTSAISINNGVSNVIEKNTFNKDSIGVAFQSFDHVPCFNNSVIANNFTDCYTLFLFYYSSNNQIYHNNFVGYSQVVVDFAIAPSQNTWDNGYPSGGNYWGLQTGTEIDNTGISNASYKVNAYGENVYPNNVDRYPLVNPFSLAFLVNYESEVVPPEVSVLSPSNRTYSDVNVSLSFAVDKPFNWVGYSFDGQDNVTVSGNTTIADVAYGIHDVTVYANSTFGVMGASNPILFTVSKPETFPALTLAIISIAGIVVLSVSLLIYKRHRKTSSKENLTDLSQNSFTRSLLSDMDSIN